MSCVSASMRQGFASLSKRQFNNAAISVALFKVSSQRRSFLSSRVSPFKVAVVGAAGGIGQPLSLLMKQNPKVSELALYDVAPGVVGVGADLAHIDSPARVNAHTGEEMAASLKNSDVIIIPAGVPRKPGMTRDDLFSINAGIVANIAKVAAQTAPSAALLIISNPVNSTVPIVAEVLKREKAYNKNKVFGVTTLDVVRANAFVAENLKRSVKDVKVPVIGGHAGITIIPLLSQVPSAQFSSADRDALTQRIMFGGDEVVKAKAGAGSATLSMAYAGAKFADSLLRALSGEKGVVECCYVESSVCPEVQYFSSPVELGKQGIAKIHSYGQLSEYEQQKLTEAIPELKASIEKGIQFVKKQAK